MRNLPWLDAKSYYTERWGEAVGRIGVDGGFSCPNRGSDRRSPGCAFCAEAGNRPPYQSGAVDLADQIRRGMAFQIERYGSQLFSLYFQSYTSTWAPVETLRRTYDEALALGSFVDLTVGTRPDCMPPEAADLLASYRTPGREVWVELGLPSCRDETLRRIGRGHDVQSFREAARRLKDREVPFTVQVMYGLPGEGKVEFLETVRTALDEGASGLKFHDLILVPGTALHREWAEGRLARVDPEAYLEAVADAVSLIPSGVVLWRVCSDPEDRKEIPGPGDKWPKNRFINKLRDKVLKHRGL